MRLNDPQIELVHDDPFMGYIETATEPAVVGDDEDVDVGENSRQSPPPATPSRSSSSSGRDDANPDQSVVIVLLVE